MGTTTKRRFNSRQNIDRLQAVMRKLVEATRFSSREFEVKTSISRQTYNGWLDGSRGAQVAALEKLANFLAVSYESLIAFLEGDQSLSDFWSYTKFNDSDGLNLESVGQWIESQNLSIKGALLQIIGASLVGEVGLSATPTASNLYVEVASFSRTQQLNLLRFLLSLMDGCPSIQTLIIAELGKENRPWSGAENPLAIFQDESMLEETALSQILSGRAPDRKECGLLARVLTKDPAGTVPYSPQDLEHLICIDGTTHDNTDYLSNLQPPKTESPAGAD